jgi:hypothetical protein
MKRPSLLPPDRRLGIIARREAGLIGAPPITGAVAIDSGGNAIYTPDGITWSVGSGLPTQMTCVTYSKTLGLYLALGNNSQGAKTPDGKVWTSFSIPARGSLVSVAWSDPLGRGVAAPSAGEAGLTSTDGTTWTSDSLTGGGGYNVLEWFPNSAVFSGAGSSSNFYSYSVNGQDGVGNWPAQFPAGLQLALATGMAQSPTKAIAVGNSGAGRGVSSPDGKNGWTNLGTIPALNYAGIAYGNSRFVAPVAGGGVQVSTDDGGSWQAGTLAAGSWTAIRFSPGASIFIIVGAAGAASKTGYSSDGLNWTLSSASVSFSKNALAVAF